MKDELTPYPHQTNTNANEDVEPYNEMSAGEEAPLDNPDTYNSGGTGSGVSPVSDITGHGRGDTRPILGRLPQASEKKTSRDLPEDNSK